jgi:hypothetical protein
LLRRSPQMPESADQSLFQGRFRRFGMTSGGEASAQKLPVFAVDHQGQMTSSISSAPDYGQVGGPTDVSFRCLRRDHLHPRAMSCRSFPDLPVLLLQDPLDHLAVLVQHQGEAPIPIGRKPLDAIGHFPHRVRVQRDPSFPRDVIEAPPRQTQNPAKALDADLLPLSFEVRLQGLMLSGVDRTNAWLF